MGDSNKIKKKRIALIRLIFSIILIIVIGIIAAMFVRYVQSTTKYDLLSIEGSVLQLKDKHNSPNK